jgi:NhaP-type Na+/H+ or K+/H+ antiporter
MLIGVFVAALFCYSLLSRPLQQSVVTAPMVFVFTGGIATLVLPDVLSATPERHVFLQLAEVGLVLLLFTDASRSDLTTLKHRGTLPARLLSVGMLLTIAVGTLAAHWLLPGLSWWEAGILGAILAPTDAGLGQVLVSSDQVPKPIREALNVEAGLNDGLSVPFLLFFIALAVSASAGDEASLLQFVGEQLGIGCLIGLVVGIAGGALLHRAHQRGWITAAFQQLGVVALPVACLLISEALGASMFIAAFVAGLAAQTVFPTVGRHSVEFAEDWGQLVNLGVFFLFGMVIARDWHALNMTSLLYAVVSLTVVRIIPVAIALIGAGLDRTSVAIIGWFGPRGLASIVLGLVYLEAEAHLPGEPMIRSAVIATVLISIFAHGITAIPCIRALSRVSFRASGSSDS